MEVFLLENVVDCLNKNGMKMILKTKSCAHTSEKIEVKNKINIRVIKNSDEIVAKIKIINIPENIAYIIISGIAQDAERYSGLYVKTAEKYTIEKNTVEISANLNTSSDKFADVIMSLFYRYKRIIESKEIKEAIKIIDKSCCRIVNEQNRISSLLPAIR